MRIGVSTSCLYPMVTEQAFRTLAESGVRETEIFFNTESETRGALLREILAIRSAYDIHVQSVHPYFTFAEARLLFDGYYRRYLDGTEYVKRLCETCTALGADRLILHGEREPFKISEEEYIERFGELAMRTAELGVTLTQENVVRFRSQDPAFLARMRQQLGDLFAMTFDVKQAVRCGVDPLSLAREFVPQIVHLHLSDHGEKGDCLPVGEGSFDFSALFRILKDGGFCGDGVLELYRSCYDDPAVLPESAEILSTLAAF